MPVRILLIEDNPGDTVIFREKLNDGDLHYELTHAKRLSEAREVLAEDDAFDIIFCDLSLPDAGGVEAVKAVSEVVPNIPLLVLTGLDDADTAARARDAGAMDYLVKWYQNGPGMARYIRYAMAHGRNDGGPPAPLEPAPPEEEQPEPDPPREPEPTPARKPAEQAKFDEASDFLLDGLRAALTYSRQIERRSRWMGEVLSVALEVEQLERLGVEPQLTKIDLRKRLDFAVRDHRSLAMKRGVPVRTTSTHERVPVVTDRNLIDILLRRLIVDALLTAQGGYLRLDLNLHKTECEIVVRWPSDEGDWLTRSDEARRLAGSVLRQLASRMGGRCEIGKDGPRESVQVWLPTHKAGE